ncbi:MAG: hypothetical protein ABEJ60_02470 [Halodesulfurarchaeum sp.]
MWRDLSWRPLASIGGALTLTVPAFLVWVRGSIHLLSTVLQVVVAGLAVFGGAFLLAWGADTAEKDVPRGIALSVLAVVAVAPEYLVDAFYAWQAGIDPGPSHAAALAIANMTGANRLLIGAGWSFIVLYALYEGDDSVRERDGLLRNALQIGEGISVELVFLLAATLYGFFVPFNLLGGLRGIDVVDLVVLVGLYVAYVVTMILAGETGGESDVGVPAYLQSFARWRRLTVVAAFFLYSAFLMLTVVEPFAHGLEQLGRQFGLPPFVVVQWLAPSPARAPNCS